MSDELEGTVRDLSRFGEGVVHTERGAVFAPGVLPGERVSLHGVHKAGKVLRARRSRVLDPSGQRVDPACPITGRCGGCPLMIATPLVQRRFKQGLLEQALTSLPGADDVEVGWVGTRAAHGYRRRARVAWTRERDLRLGFRTPRSNKITDVARCAVLHPAIDGALRHVREALSTHLAGRGEVHLALGAEERAVAALRSDDAQPPEVFGALEVAVAEGILAGAALRAGGASVDAVFGDPREIRRGADDEPLVGTVAGFSQPHDEMNHALVRRVLELARPEKRSVLELFCGAGNLTVALARAASELVAIEQDQAAADACRRNLEARGIDAAVRAADAEGYRPKSRPDVVVLDPPRTGAPGAIKRIIARGIGEVVYVSCDPPTLARDLARLAEAGYRLTDAVAFDMFPQTAHVESVVRMELSG